MTDANASPRLYSKHERYAREERMRYSDQKQSFLNAEHTRLAAGATAQTVTVNTNHAGVAAAQTYTVGGGGSTIKDGDTIIVGGVTYTWQTTLTAGNGNVHIGANDTAALLNMSRAINQSGGVQDTDYDHANTAANAFVTASPTATTLVATAKTAGVNGNHISVYAPAGAGTWGDNRLTGGVDDWTLFTATSHPYKNGEGPLNWSTAPSDLSTATEYWVAVVSSSTIKLATSLANLAAGYFIGTTDSASFALKRGTTEANMFDLLKSNSAQAIKDASDIDNLA